VGEGKVLKRVQAETPKWKCYQAETPKLWECYQAAGGNSEIVEMLPSRCRRKLQNCGNVTLKQVQAETPKLWECYQAGAGGNSEMEMLPGGNSEIVEMLPSRWWKFRNWGILCKDGKQVPCGNSTIEGILCRLWECYQAGALRQFRQCCDL